MVTTKLVFLSVLLLILPSSIHCDKEDDSLEINEKEYDEIGDKFLSLLSNDLKEKIVKSQQANKAAGILDPKNFNKDQLTKEEMKQIQKALVVAMQPLFGKMVSELAGQNFDSDEEQMEVDGPQNATDDKEVDEEIEEKEKKSEKKTTEKTTSEKKNQDNVEGEKKGKETEQDEKPKEETRKQETKKGTGKSKKTKKDSKKGKKKSDKEKEGKAGTKQKEEL